MRYPQALVVRLGDGAEHSGQALADEFGLSRAAIQKQVQGLAELGLAVHAVRGHGYRLEQPLVPLSVAAIEAELDTPVRARLQRLQVDGITESTNSTLLAREPPPAGLADVLLAEYQSGGRGRRGRRWVAPFGSGILASVAWTYPESRSDLSAVTLAVGVALVRALGSLGVTGTRLKWPNDVEVGGAKLAGVLCELKVEAGGPAHVVVGVGLNVALPEASVAELGAQGRLVTDVMRVAPALTPAVRPRLAACLIAELVRALDEFGRHGFAAFIAEWRLADALQGVPVRVEAGGAVREGIARGISADGALKVEVDGVLERVDAGEVSVRVQP